MKLKILSTLIPFVWVANVFGGISDHKVHLHASGGKLICDVDFGFHFNTKAPTSLEVDGKKYQPSSKEEKSLGFNMSAAGREAFKLHFYVCDDALTICEPHDYDLKVSGDQVMQLAARVTESSQSDFKILNTDTSKTNRVNENGFLEDQFQNAVALARSERKLILVDFRAPWCPACLRLETESFNQKVFKTATNKFVKLSLNIDLDQNKAIADHYSVKAIPTMILMNAEEAELYRSLDFKSAEVLAKEISKLKAKDLMSDQDLKQNADLKNDQKSTWVLAKRYSDAMKFQDALTWYKKLKAPNAQQRLMAAAAEIALLSELDSTEASEKIKIATYQKAIGEFSGSFDAIVWRNEFAGVFNEKNQRTRDPKDAAPQSLFTENLNHITRMLAKTELRLKAFENSYQGDFSNFEKAELLNQKIETIKLMQDTKALTSAKADLLQDIHARNLTIERTGELLMAISYLKACDQKDEVLNWYQKLIAREPESFVFYAKLANYQHELKADDQAKKAALKAVELGPELAFRNLRLLALIQKSLKENQDAQVTIAKALALPDAKVEKNKAAAAELRKLQETLTAH